MKLFPNEYHIFAPLGLYSRENSSMAATEEANFSFYMQGDMVFLWGKEDDSEQIQKAFSLH